MTPEDHLKMAEDLHALAASYLADGRPDMCAGAATLAGSHYTAYAATSGVMHMRAVMVADTAQRAAERPPPEQVLIEFLRIVQDSIVRTVDDAVIIDDGTVQNLTWTRVARAAFNAGLVEVHSDPDGKGPLWLLTGRGRETLDRGAV